VGGAPDVTARTADTRPLGARLLLADGHWTALRNSTGHRGLRPGPPRPVLGSYAYETGTPKPRSGC
jgi:hypothetical protein